MSLDYTDPSKKALANFGTKALILTGIISFIFLIFAFVFFKASKNSESFFDSNIEQVVTEQNYETEQNNDLETVQEYEFATDEKHY